MSRFYKISKIHHYHLIPIWFWLSGHVWALVMWLAGAENPFEWEFKNFLTPTSLFKRLNTIFPHINKLFCPRKALLFYKIKKTTEKTHFWKMRLFYIFIFWKTVQVRVQRTASKTWALEMALVYLKRKVGHIIKSESFKLGNFYFELEILYVVGKMVISNFNFYSQFDLVFGIRIFQTTMKILS